MPRANIYVEKQSSVLQSYRSTEDRLRSFDYPRIADFRNLTWIRLIVNHSAFMARKATISWSVVRLLTL